MNPKALLHEYKNKIDDELKKYFERKKEEYKIISPFIVNFIKDLEDFTLRGGKRLRPSLIFYSYKLFGGKDDDEIVRLSIFIEIIQSFLLIHDDIMDRALLRRGGKTIHKVYEDVSKDLKFGDDEHFGTTMAILSGDLANQLALEIIADSEFPDAYKSKLLKLVSSEIAKVSFGQIHDILLNYNYPPKYQEEDILKVHTYKTATYTYKLPLFAGAILAGASESELGALEGYAIPSGIAFQIRDDILGVFGREEETGKETISDLLEGKKTLLVTEAYKNGSQQQKDQLDKYLGKKDLSDEEANTCREIFKDTKALEYSKKECERQVELAKKSLRTLSNKDDEAYQFLEGIAEYMIVRNI